MTSEQACAPSKAVTKRYRQILERMSIFDVIRTRIPLVATQRDNQRRGVCPFCGSSQFYVRPSPGFFYCYKCRSNGDALRFVTAFEKRPLSDVIADFAKQVGVELKDGDLVDPESVNCPFRRGLSRCDRCCRILPDDTKPTQATTDAIENQSATKEESDTVKPRVKQRRGFAAMDKEAHRELARSGGVAVHAMGLAHKFSSEEAQKAGKKGGRTTSANREHMVEIGRRGGYAKRGFRMDQDASARASKKS